MEHGDISRPRSLAGPPPAPILSIIVSVLELIGGNQAALTRKCCGQCHVQHFLLLLPEGVVTRVKTGSPNIVWQKTIERMQ